MKVQVFNKVYLIIVSIISTVIIDNAIPNHVDFTTDVKYIVCSCRISTTTTWRGT